MPDEKRGDISQPWWGEPDVEEKGQLPFGQRETYYYYTKKTFQYGYFVVIVDLKTQAARSGPENDDIYNRWQKNKLPGFLDAKSFGVSGQYSKCEMVLVYCGDKGKLSDCLVFEEGKRK